MKKQALVCALLLVSYEYYQYRSTIEAIPAVVEPEVFRLPFIQHAAGLENYNLVYHDYLEMGNSVFMGLFQWCDTLRIPDAFIQYDLHPAKREYEFLWKGKNADFKTDGFRLVPDYNSTIVCESAPWDWHLHGQKWAYYPVYVVNQTNSPRYFILRDDCVFALQEAEYPYGVHADVFWPIEYNSKNYKAVGKSAIKVEPDEFMMFIVPKYMGSTETKLRVRLKNGDNIIVSDAFTGKVNYDQFFARPESPLDLMIKKTQFKYCEFIPYMFLGALPKQTEYDRS